MQLRKQYKQLWFVFLMIFFIGGSGVVAAAVPSIQSDTTVQTIPCHEQHMADHHLQMSHADASTFLLEKCHTQKMQGDHQHCQDCNSPLHCQTVNFALDQQTPIIFSSPLLEPPTHKNTDYQARHLAGYWHEILRPPKT
ncbi:hypothetical protein EXE30_09240 [Acinetobacter halotolerans]|uniref:DUF2946 domain-containing protein n=1 Tax=Acinetobacter halotolerans TaxID=1752076 RepID=A0A4Q6XI55_9GAMM|nr:hypothetical protein [Acinetobacter halotolerans]RZF52738.1 hypothetical protein EXE30_09240 [Acinetobacter halotolerans]